MWTVKTSRWWSGGGKDAASAFPSFAAAPIDGEWSWALLDSLTIDPAETVADITPQVRHLCGPFTTRAERQPRSDKSAGVVSTSIQPMPIRRVPLEWLAGVASPGGADLGHLCGPFTTRAERQPRSEGQKVGQEASLRFRQAGRPENPRQLFPSLMKASPAGFLLRPPENG